MDNHMDKLTAEFNAAMIDVYYRGKNELGYRATKFLHMVNKHGGIETARRLLVSSKISYGFTKLWDYRRLDLTVECLVLNERFRELFNGDQLETARRRLRDFDFDPRKCEHANR